MHENMAAADENWDDLRYFLAVARAGSFSAGALALRINQSTVSRRIGGFEGRVGARLFDRLPRGLRLTEAGQELLGHAARVASEFDAFAEALAGRDAQLSGDVLMATTASMALMVVPALETFSRLHPRVVVEISTSYRELSLAGREADLALRATRNPPDSAFGRRLASVAVAEYVAAGTSDEQRDALPWIVPPKALTAIDQTPSGQRVVARQGSSPLVAASVRGRLGRAMLPCFVADEDPGLRRVAGTLIPRVNDLWLLAHPDMRNRARVRALMAHLAEFLEPKRGLFEGARGG
jgi:DNA-binding transcriptional LysR family regulator